MSQEYHCPECGAKIGFGESICPNCNADVNSVWENAASPKKNKPKVAPGMGGLDEGDEGSPFPPAEDQGDSPFPPAGDQGGSPFPPSNEQGGGSSPFPSPSGDQDQGKAVPGTGTGEDQGGQGSPFPSPAGGDQSSGNSGSKPFPPAPEASSQAPQQPKSGPHFEIPRIESELYIPEGENVYGRHEIQGIAKKALPDMNAYKNISRQHFYLNREGDKITIEDKGSTNGTYLGTKKITGQGPQTLKDGDKVILPIEENGQMVQLEMIYKKS